MKEIHIMIGVPGSGKSTFAQRLATGPWVISPDKIRKQLTGAKLDQSMNKTVFENMYHEIDQMMKREDSFVIDATNANWVYRLELLTYLNNPKRIEENIPTTILNPETGDEFAVDVAHVRESRRYQIIGWYIEASFTEAVLNNEERPEDERVPASVIYNMCKNLEEHPPSLDEGFDVLYRIKVNR